MEKVDGATVVDEEKESEAGREGISLTTVVNEALGTTPGPSKYKELKEELAA
jgi:hypothetical protein